MTKWTRVRDKRTGHHYTVAVVDPKHHEVLQQDAVGSNGAPLPAKPKESPKPVVKSKKENDS